MVVKEFKWGNESSIKVLSIDTYKLNISCGCTLYFYDVLYVLKVQWNLLLDSSMWSLEFVFKLDEYGVNIYLKSTNYGCGYICKGLIVLNIDYIAIIMSMSLFVLLHIVILILWHGMLELAI